MTVETASLTRQLRLLGNLTMRIASKVAQQDRGPADRSVFQGLEQDSDLWLLAAKDMYEERLSRRRYFSPELFREPAWDILLDLYIAEKEGLPVSITSACIGGQVPMTTALRHLKVLEEEDLVVRETDPRDARRRYVRISERGYAQMTAFIADRRKDWLTDELSRSHSTHQPGGEPTVRQPLRRTA